MSIFMAKMEMEIEAHRARRELIGRIQTLLSAADVAAAGKPELCAALLCEVAAKSQQLESWLKARTI